MKALFIPRPQAARRLRLSLRTFDRLVRQGQIRVRRIGRRVLVRPEELERFARGAVKLGRPGKESDKETASVFFGNAEKNGSKLLQ